MDEAERLLGEVSERSKNLTRGMENLMREQQSTRDDVTRNTRDLEDLRKDDYAQIRKVIRDEIVAHARERGITSREVLVILLTAANLIIVALPHLLR